MPPWSEFWPSILILKVQRTSMSFKSSFWALEEAGGFWVLFGILILIWIWSLVFVTPMIKIFYLYLYLEGAKKIHVLQVIISALEDAGVSWMEFGILIMIWVWSLVSDTPMIQFLALYIDFEGAKNIHVLYVLIGTFENDRRPDGSLKSWSWFQYCHCLLICSFLKFKLSILILNMQR